MQKILGSNIIKKLDFVINTQKYLITIILRIIIYY